MNAANPLVRLALERALKRNRGKRASKRDRRGIASFLALMFVALLSVLALGVYSSTTLTVQTSANERRVNYAQLAAESGMELVRQQVASVSIPYNTAPADLFAQLASDLQTQLNGSSTLGGANVEVDAANSTVYIPARSANPIALGSNAGTFRALIKTTGTQLHVKTTGYDDQGSFQRDIALDYAIAMKASNIFDFGVASKGPISMNGNVSIKGTAGNEVFGSVLVVSDDNTVPLTMIGNAAISGDVSLTRNDPASVSVSSSSSIAGFTKNHSNFVKHVHDKVTEPEFPIIETTAFKPYATNVISPAASAPSGPVGGAGQAAGFVGLTYFNIQNNCSVKAYDSVNSTVVGSVTALGQTNAGGNLSGMTFAGEIDYKTAFSMNQATVTTLKKVTSTLSFPAATTPATGVVNKGNYNGPSGASETFAGGKYYFQTFSVPSGKTVIFTGPVELYVNGSCNITGNVTSFENKAWNTKIRMVASAGVDLNGGTNPQPLYVDVYAPESPLNINNRSNVYGSFIMNGINVSNSNVIIDRAVKANGGATAVPTAPASAPASPDGVTTLSGTYYKNILIKANTNPKFTGNKTFDGVIYVEWPNKVEFAGNTTVNGVVVVQTDGNNNIGLDPAKNTISFTGNVTVKSLSTLPTSVDFPVALKQMTGAFLLAPGFGTSFTGNFGTVSGSIVSSSLTFSGNAGGTVTGSVINLSNTPFSMSGNSDIVIQSNGTAAYPAGVYFGSRFDPLPDSYTEVTE